MEGKLHIKTSEKGYQYTSIYGKVYYVRCKGTPEFPEYINYEGFIKGKSLVINKWTPCDEFKPSRVSSTKTVDYGADFETAIMKDGRIILPEEFEDEGVTKQNSEAIILAGAFIARSKEFIYDATKMTMNDLEGFLFNEENKILRFYNVEYDGKYILNILFKNGYKEVQEFNDRSEKEFIALKNPFGKIFQISYIVVTEDVDQVSGLPYRNVFTTKIMDTYKLFPGTSLKKGLESFNVKNDHGKPLRKMDMGFGRADTFDKDGNIKDDFMLYMKKDAEGARRLYHTFIETLASEKKKLDFLTIGAVAWKEMIDRCFGGDVENFKAVCGDIPSEIEDKYRKGLYRGGYGLLNNKYYQKEIKDVWHADYVSMYPGLMTQIKHPVGEGIEYPKYKAPTEKRPIAVHHLRIHKAYLKKGYFPILIDGRKTEEHDNYLFEVNETMELMLFEEFGAESEFSIFLRTYEGKNFEVLSSRLFEAKTGLFDNFIEYWYPIKENAPKDSPERNLAKLILNNSFGKIGENYKKAITYFEQDEDGEFVVLTKTEDVKETNTRNVFMASNITHKGRVKVWLDAETIGFERVILVATDGIFWVGECDKLTFGKTLGDLDLEDRGVDMWAFGEKAYQIWNGKKLITKCNGMKDEVKEKLAWKELVPNLEFSMFKKQNFKGGSVLMPVTLKLKPRNITNEGV